MAVTSYSKTFEETYKTAYSHGFESIYALENIDLKSIRRIEQPSQEHAPIEFQSKIVISQPGSAQLELDLGPEYRCWSVPFLGREPIQVLELSRHAERCLLEHGKSELKDLVQANLRDFVFFKGMGQGHIDEIQQKLRDYLKGRSLQYANAIDYTSWLRSLVGALDRKKVFASLQSYQINDIYSLTPAETVEVGRLTVEKRQEWSQEMHELFRSDSRTKSVIADMGIMADTFIKPWIRRRKGIANLHELNERIQRTSANPGSSLSILHFFSEIYFDNDFPLHRYLHTVENELYCADDATVHDFHLVIKTASSYFYKAYISYNLSELIVLIERELARSWHGFPEGFSEKVLRYSSQFRVRKGPDGALVIRLA